MTLLRALRRRNYRLFCAEQGISLIGRWLQRIAVPVYEQKGSLTWQSGSQ